MSRFITTSIACLIIKTFFQCIYRISETWILIVILNEILFLLYRLAFPVSCCFYHVVLKLIPELRDIFHLIGIFFFFLGNKVLEDFAVLSYFLVFLIVEISWTLWFFSKILRDVLELLLLDFLNFIMSLDFTSNFLKFKISLLLNTVYYFFIRCGEVGLWADQYLIKLRITLPYILYPFKTLLNDST